MKNDKIFNYLMSLLLIPLWLGLVTDFIKKIPLLHYTAIVITTLLSAFFLIRVIREMRIELDSNYNYQCRRIDKMIFRTRKRLQKIITRTSDVSVMDYALTKLREICTSKIYTNILTGMAEKERRIDIKEILLLKIQSIGGNNEK